VVAALGDSITAGSPGYDPDPEQRRALGFGDDERSQYEYWAARAEPALRFRNCGVYGERSDEIAKRLDECAAGADALIVQGGINDIAQGYPSVQAADHLQAMVARGGELGLAVFLANVLPWNNGHPRADPAIAELNRLIGHVGADEGVPVLDFHEAIADPGRPALMAPDLTSDGDHPSVAGYRLLGELVARKLGPLARYGSRRGRRSSAGGSPESPGGQDPNQLSRAPSMVSTVPEKKSPAGEAR
jgi:lysophospholipase L1-like esterase